MKAKFYSINYFSNVLNIILVFEDENLEEEINNYIDKCYKYNTFCEKLNETFFKSNVKIKELKNLDNAPTIDLLNIYQNLVDTYNPIAFEQNFGNSIFKIKSNSKLINKKLNTISKSKKKKENKSIVRISNQEINKKQFNQLNTLNKKELKTVDVVFEDCIENSSKDFKDINYNYDKYSLDEILKNRKFIKINRNYDYNNKENRIKNIQFYKKFKDNLF